MSRRASRPVTACVVVWVVLLWLPGDAAAQADIPAATQQEEQAEDESSEATPEREFIPFPVLISNPTNGFGGGGGIRFLLLEDRDVLVGLDVAIGRFGNRGLYFSFGEAF